MRRLPFARRLLPYLIYNLLKMNIDTYTYQSCAMGLPEYTINMEQKHI